MRAFAACLLVLASLCGSAFPAHAAELRWAAPPSCEQAESTRQQIEKLIGRTLASVDDIDFDVQVRQLAQQRWQVVLRTRPRQAQPDAQADARTRELTGGSCAQVTQAAAVAIAMTITGRDEESSGYAASQPAPAAAGGGDANAPTTADATPPTAAISSAARASSDVRRDKVQLAVAGGLALDSGALPAAAGGAQLELSARLHAVRLIALGTLFASQTTRLPGATRGGEFSLALGALLGCFERGVGAARVGGCAGFELGALSASGQGVELSHTRSTGWRAVRTEASLVWAVGGGVGVALRAGITLPLERDTFLLDDKDRVHRPSSMTGRALLGVEFEL